MQYLKVNRDYVLLNNAHPYIYPTNFSDKKYKAANSLGNTFASFPQTLVYCCSSRNTPNLNHSA